MAAHDDGGPAFPICDMSQNTATGETTAHQFINSGLTLRDYFAAKAMQAMCSGQQWPTPQEMQEIARRSYMQADLMLAVRRGA